MVDIWALGILLYFMLVGVTPCPFFAYILTNKILIYLVRGETVSDLKRNILEGIYYMPEYGKIKRSHSQAILTHLVSTFAQHFITRMLELDAKRRANITELKVGNTS